MITDIVDWRGDIKDNYLILDDLKDKDDNYILEKVKEAENDNFQYFLIWSKKIYEVRKPQYIAIERNRENEIAYVCGFYGKMR